MKGPPPALLTFFVLLLCIAPVTATELDIGSLEPTFEQFFNPDNHTYTGAVVTVVHRGEVVIQKGYGYSDAQRSQPVDIQHTRFRLASTTKTLVAVALGQLLDRGQLKSIDDPVNTYLQSWQLPDNQGKPITLRMLATHQAGFAESRQPFQRQGQATPRVDGAYLLAHRPPYIRPVNSGANYSNYGINILANVITELTSLTFKDYVQRHIFDPLDMDTALIIEEPLAHPNMAEAQMFYGDGTTVGIPPAWANNPMNTASGAMAASAEDMGKFMQALLVAGDNNLLSAETRSLLFSRLGETHPLAQGYGVIFMHNRYNDTVLVEHGGSTLGAISYTSLIPGQQLGVFVSITGREGTIPPGFEALGIVPRERNGPPVKLPINFPGFFDARSAYLEALLGPPQLPVASSTLPLSANLDDYTGNYTPERRAAHSVTRLFQQLLLGGGIRVTASGDDTLSIRGIDDYRAVSADLFWRSPDSTPPISTGWRDFYIFTRNAQGEVEEMISQYTDAVFVRQTGFDSPVLQAKVLAISVAVLLTGLIYPLLARSTAWHRFLPTTLALALLGLPMAYLSAWPRLGNEAISYVSISAAELIPLQIIGNLCALLMLALILKFRGAGGAQSLIARIHYCLLTAAAVPALWTFWQFDLVGWYIH